jgi:Flp pilus assembly pilin Flp
VRNRSQEGASAAEYGLLVALIAAVVMGAVLTLGQTDRLNYQDSCTTVSEAMGSAC